MTTRTRLVEGFRRGRATSPLLVWVSLSLLGFFGFSMVGLVVDPRRITGSPAWFKPAKFAISSAIYCGTLAWLVASVPRPSRWLRGTGESVAVILALEVAIIALQAARGTTSHFNRATPLDGALFGIMGLSVAVLLVASAVFAVELCRASFADRGWGWALRLGMLVSVLGAATGGFMLRPTADQQARAKVTGSIPIVGGHTVGAADGGPGLPGTGWSRDHGDLRIPHFFGLHAVQAIPILAWLAFRGLKPRSSRTRIALVALISLSYSALIVLLTARAMAGRPFLAGDPAILRAFACWLILTSAGFVVLMVRERSWTPSASFGVGA